MVELIEKLCRQNAVSGNEGGVREIIKTELEGFYDEMFTDSIGNLFVIKHGNDTGKSILISANTDEPGFIVSGYTDAGYLKFKPVGHTEVRSLISKCVKIGDKGVDGVIGMKAIHLQKKEERESTVGVSKLFIDIGAKDKEEAKKYVDLGDYVSFATEPKVIGKRIKAKALSSRAACACLIEIMKELTVPPCNVCACFTAQKEVGARGAKIAAMRIKADRALIIGAVECADMYKAEDADKRAVLGEGAVIEDINRGVINDKAATEELIKAAEGVKIQRKRGTGERSDAYGIQTAGEGVIATSILVPIRYKNTPVEMADINDIEAVKQLGKKWIER